MTMKKIILIVGTRPNYIKAFPVYSALSKNFDITMIHTGQHYDNNMNEIFFNELGMKKPDVQLNLNQSGECLQLSEIIFKLHDVLNNIKPDLVIVFGDVTSTLAGALAANKLKIKLAHVESGLRSFDMTMSEEINRIIVDNISDILFVTEQSGLKNLSDSKCQGEKYLVGNTMIDTLVKFDKIINTNNINNTKNDDYIVLTIHRQSNVDNSKNLRQIVECLNKLATKYNFIFPIHHRTREKVKNLNLEFHENIKLLQPLGYMEFMKYIKQAKLVITDSGGIQEETSFLGIHCITLRDTTERPATLIENGGSSILASLDQLETYVDKFYGKKINTQIHLWDGCAGERICEILKKIIY